MAVKEGRRREVQGLTYHQIRVLASRHLMGEHARVRRPYVGFEAAIKHANLRPVKVKSLYVSVANSSAKTGLL